MSWEVFYTSAAQRDLRDIYEYLATTLHAPAAAERTAKRIMETVRSLECMPLRYRLYEREPWNSLGLRVVRAGSYLVFYLPDEDEHRVQIVRIMYEGRDAAAQLESSDGLDNHLGTGTIIWGQAPMIEILKMRAGRL